MPTAPITRTDVIVARMFHRRIGTSITKHMLENYEERYRIENGGSFS